MALDEQMTVWEGTLPVQYGDVLRFQLAADEKAARLVVSRGDGGNPLLQIAVGVPRPEPALDGDAPDFPDTWEA